MANKTIYGCIEPSTGVVTFEGEACDSGDYTGCYVAAAGAHQGQIAVTISELYCADTYYACFNSTTGKFQLIIPDDCCGISSECEHCTGYQPAWIDVTLTGLTNCSCAANAPFGSYYASGFEVVNDTRRVYHNSGCVYDTSWTGQTFGQIHIYRDSVCDDFAQTNTYDALRIVVTLTATGANIIVYFGQETYTPYDFLLFDGTIVYMGIDECGSTIQSANNDITACWVSTTRYPCGSSGLVTISII
ncbi:hypothetical protein LCGC14_1636760 [marine sediment metagenome]|uniref:Uncharacterized protein n=1 Tax=marine sediment metagenome TaxID=412755 RepID=A0A0F9KGL4_9ZZZZ